MLWSAVILGFLGSLHCIGMCGPIAFVLPLSHNNPLKKTAQIFLYHTGRIFSYSLLGLMFGVLGKALYVSGLQQRLSIVIGLLIIIAVLLPKKVTAKFNSTKPVYKVIFKIKNRLGLLLKQKNKKALLTIGVLNGFLPCGLVYMALFGAVAMGQPVKSAFYMALFGLGTIPLMTGAAYLGNFLSVTTRQKIRQLVPVFVVVLGMLFILRGMGLGIPFISPADVQLIVKANPDCVVP